MKYLIESNLVDNLTIRRNALGILNDDKIAFFICNPRLLKDLKDKEKWFFAPIPSNSQSISASNSFIISINSNSKKISLCKKIIKFMISKKFQRLLGAEQGIAPVCNESLIQNYNTPNLKAIIDIAYNAKKIPNNIESWNVRDEIDKNIEQFLRGILDIKGMEFNINNKIYEERKEYNAINLLGMS